MDIRICDRSRNVTVTLTAPSEGDVVAALRKLAAGQIAGQVEFDLDQEAFDALKEANPDGLVLHDDRPPLVATLDGVPVLVAADA